MQKNIEVVRRSLDALNRRDLQEYLETFHPDVEIDWSRSRAPTSGVYQGHDGLRKLLDEYWDTFEDTHIEAHDFIETGSSVVVPNTAAIHGRDGVEVVARSTFVFAVEDGRISRLRMFQEHAEALEAVGLGEPAP